VELDLRNKGKNEFWACKECRHKFKCEEVADSWTQITIQLLCDVLVTPAHAAPHHGGRSASGGENGRHGGRAAGGGGDEAPPGDFGDSPDRTLGEPVPDPARPANFHICANSATCRTVAKKRGVDEKQLVLWNMAKFPGLTATVKLKKGTTLTLIAPASDEDSHKDAPLRHQQQKVDGYNAKGKHSPNAGKRQ
jgi:hypothetical protein